MQQLGTSIVADSAPKLVTWPCSGHGSGQWWRPKMRNGLLLRVALLEGMVHDGSGGQVWVSGPDVAQDHVDM